MARIMVVEDDTLTAAALAHFLRTLGHEVRKVGSLREARDAALAGVDLLLSDLNLPDGGGDELAASLRVPAIALSGMDREEDRLRSRRAGFAVHLTKPIDLDALEVEIRRVLATPVARP